MSEQHRVDVEYRLSGPGGRSADTHGKSWYFDVPGEVDWGEVLHRVFYDANVGMRRREPRDESWLDLDTFDVTPVSLDTMLAWDGEPTTEKAVTHLPWILGPAAVTWEYTSCYLLDGAGGYDGMTGYDFSELILYRALAAGRVTRTAPGEFLDKLYPGKGASVFADRTARTANLVVVRPTPAFRRPPGSTPHVSGPIRHADLP